MEVTQKFSVNLFSAILLLCLRYGYAGKVDMRGGQCISKAQFACRNEMTDLLEAEGTSNPNLCRYFNHYDACMGPSMLQCKVTAGERMLYDKDIVKVYTSPPYDCNGAHGVANFAGVHNTGESPYHKRRFAVPSLLLMGVVLANLLT